MTSTLPGIQITHRCAWRDNDGLCGAPAPYLIGGTSYCHDHALTATPQIKPYTGTITPRQAAEIRDHLTGTNRKP